MKLGGGESREITLQPVQSSELIEISCFVGIGFNGSLYQTANSAEIRYERVLITSI